MGFEKIYADVYSGVVRITASSWGYLFWNAVCLLAVLLLATSCCEKRPQQVTNPIEMMQICQEQFIDLSCTKVALHYQPTTKDSICSCEVASEAKVAE